MILKLTHLDNDFLKLIEKPVLVNINNIILFEERDGYTRLSYNQGKYSSFINVKESINEIEDLMKGRR